jgi:lantibiotic biosynthesis protein
LTWLTPASQLPSWQRQLCPNGHYNLGLAHGVPGLLPMLARACAIPETRVQAWELLLGAGRWLAAQQQRDATGCWFPHWLAAEVEPEPGWVAWCYGSLGAATAWLDAARRTGQRDWERAALAMLRRIAQIPVAEASVRSDAALCHGAAGNAHIFNRLYQATDEVVFQAAALRWYAHTLALRVPGTGLAGFQRWMPSESGKPDWKSSTGFLDGVAGIGLALLAACTEDEPQWDSLLAVALA